jgi:pimeloyl-ACP methyl ester carboxylesterase
VLTECPHSDAIQHDFGAPVGFQIAMQAPERVLGLIVQNANAHRTGLGPQWAPGAGLLGAAESGESGGGNRASDIRGHANGYIGGAPPDVAARIPAESWEEDWRVMNLPGRMDTQRALVADYGRYVARFDAIAEYLARWQPPSLMVWGRRRTSRFTDAH